MEEEATIQQADLPQDPAFEEMIQAGVFYGRKKSKTNPKMKDFIFGNRGGMEIIDLQKTQEGIEQAIVFLQEKIMGGGLVLLVGTQPMAKSIESMGVEFQFPYVTKRWLGGTLTNFKTLSERINYFKKLKSDLASGALEKYTKKERVTFEKQMERLRGLMEGLENLVKLPDAVLMIDPMAHTTAVREANRLHIPIIALTNTDANPDCIDYLVAGNNKSTKSIEWFLEKISAVIRDANEKRLLAQPKQPADLPPEENKF